MWIQDETKLLESIKPLSHLEEVTDDIVDLLGCHVSPSWKPSDHQMYTRTCSGG